MEFNAFRQSTTLSLSIGHYEEIDSYYVNDYLVGEERAAEMNANIAYAVTKQIKTKKNVAYVPTRHWIETKRM